MWLKIKNTLINKNEILAIIPYEIKNRKTTEYRIAIDVKSYSQRSETYIATYNNETQWKTAYQSLIKELENE